MIRTRLFEKILTALMVAMIATGLSFSFGFADDASGREIWLSRYTADIDEGESFCLKAAYNTLEDGSFTFESTNGDVATVSNDGTVTAISEGMAWISVSDGNLKATCSVYVNEPKAKGLSLSSNSIGIARSASYVLSAELSEAYKGQKIVWSSADSSVASVNEGVITGVKNGQTIIRAALADKPEVYDECDIMVGTLNTYTNFSDKAEANADSSALQYVYAKPGTNEWKKARTDGKSGMYRLINDDSVVITSWGMYSGSYYDSARVFCAPASGTVDVSVGGENYFTLEPGDKTSETPGKGRLEIILNNTVIKSLDLESFKLTDGEYKGQYAASTFYNGGEPGQKGDKNGSHGISMADWLGKLSVNVHKGDKLYIAFRNEGKNTIVLKNWVGYNFVYNSTKSVDSIDVTEDNISLKEGKIFDNFKAELKGNDFGDSKIEYLSGDEAVAKVSKDGIIKGEKAGETRVYAINRDYKLISYADVTTEKSDVETVNKPTYKSDDRTLEFSVRNNGDEDTSLQTVAVLRDKIGRTLSANVGDLLNVNAGSEKEFKLENIYNKDAAVIDIYLINTNNGIVRCICSERVEIK